MGSDIFNLAGRIALVTGSSRGIGYAVAHGLAEAGATLVLNGRDEGRLESARQRLGEAGHGVHALAFDVTSPADVQRAVDSIESGIGAIDILVNNAGMQFRTPLEDYPEDTWQALMKTNVDSVFHVGKAVARHMIPRRRGRIINICSVISEVARTGIAPYAASKGAVKMLTKGMAVDWAPHGIQVNGIGPGYFATELNSALMEDESFNSWLVNRTPMGRWGELPELAGAAVFLASDAASFVNGHILYVDGGITATL